MLSSLILLAAVALIISRLFGATLRVVREAPASVDAITRHETMLAELRRDVWSASDARVDGDEIVVVEASGSETRWRRVNADMVRISAAGQRVWLDGGRDVSFEPAAGGLLVRSSRAATSAGDEALLINELKLLRGMRP
jgi:hypothetical protein